MECERPTPESLTPPQAHWQAPWLKEWSLTQTMPDSIRRAIRSPFWRSLVQTEAPRPNSESLARSIASCSESTTTIGSTGPKISSRMIRISCVTPVSTVGATNLPESPATSVGPPQSLVAPEATASSISSTTISYWPSEVIGPISVSHSSGSPSRSFCVSRATPSMKRSATSRTT